MASTQGTGEVRPATLNRDDITDRLRSAEAICRTSHSWMVREERHLAVGLPVHRDSKGRSAAEQYHFWCGVAEAYAAMLVELDRREARS